MEMWPIRFIYFDHGRPRHSGYVSFETKKILFWVVAYQNQFEALTGLCWPCFPFLPLGRGWASGILQLMSTLQPSLNCSRPRCQQVIWFSCPGYIWTFHTQVSLTWASLLLTPLKFLTLTSTQLSKLVWAMFKFWNVIFPVLTTLCRSRSTSRSTTLSSRTLLLLRYFCLEITTTNHKWLTILLWFL